MAEFTPITLSTQEEADNYAKERIARVEKKYENYVSKENHQKAIDEKIAELTTSFNSEKSAWEEEKNGYIAKISDYETISAKKDIAKKYGLDESLVERLKGSNKDEWEKDAEELSSIFNRRKNQPGKEGNQGSSDNPYKSMVKKLTNK